MTSLKPHSHGLLANGSKPMPDVPTMAQTFRDAGYHATAVGKLHVNPQRQRLGFDEVLLDEEGRGHEGCRMDDYELFLADQGHVGERFAGGMNNNEYVWRPWHLNERLHVTNWAAWQMSRQIVRRDPTKPGFFYLSFSHPHPPLAPLQAYLDMYRDVPIDEPYVGDWVSGDHNQLPPAIQREVQRMLDSGRDFKPGEIAAIRRAFYALCTHIDHQIRVVIGTLRQEGMMDDTIICFTADHGDMLGNHRMWAKHWMYEDSARVPMLLMGTKQQSDDGTVGYGLVDDRLVATADIMPTLLTLAGIEPPSHCEGISMVGDTKHEYLYGVWGAGTNAEGAVSTRMIRDERFKLVYYPFGNTLQLFDMANDPDELHDLAGDESFEQELGRLCALLVSNLRDDECDWVKDGQLVGVPGEPVAPGVNRGLSGQRGTQLPPVRVGDLKWS